MTNNLISQLTGVKYINLETYRKDGRSVRTPVWFIDFRDRIYVRTDANSGKIRRIVNNQNVRIAPCDIRGKINSNWIKGKARIEKEDDIEFKEIISLINKKYSFQQVFVKIVYKLRKIKVAIVSIELIASTDGGDTS
jgi:PPOX class probable F420-dependent enzyme